MGSVAVVLALIIYWPAMHGQMLWDDSGHLTGLSQQGWDGLASMWTRIGATQQYYPLLYSVFWLEHRIWGNPAVLFGDNTFPYHVMNVLQHAGVALVLWHVLRRLAVPGAWLAALLFLVHPVNVESVAWMSEQKNTLSALFFLGALACWLRFDDTRRRGPYAAALALFVLGLLTKSVIATLPGVVLVIAWWKRGSLSWQRDVRPVIPFAALAVVSGLVTAWLEYHSVGAHGAEFELSLVQRTLLAAHALWFYLGSLAWPVHLAFFYERWVVSAADPLQWLYLVAIVAVLAALWRFRHRSRAPLAALLIFIGASFPVLGFVNVYPFRFSWVADHFQYLPSMAMFALAAGAAVTIWNRSTHLVRTAGALALSLVLITLAIMTSRQSRLYGADDITLYRATIERTPSAWEARFSLASSLMQQGAYAAAIEQVDEGLRYKADDALAVSTKADALASLGRTDDAIAAFNAAIAIDSTRSEIHFDYSTLLFRLKRFPDAIRELETTIRLQPGTSQAHFNLAAVLAEVGDRQRALAELEETARLSPQWPEMLRNVGNGFIALGDTARGLAVLALIRR